jgi:hypothetical protein
MRPYLYGHRVESLKNPSFYWKNRTFQAPEVSTHIYIYMNSIFLINWNDVGTSSFVSFNIRISAAHYFFLMAIKKNQLYFCSWNTLHSWLGFHYQKIDKYKQKYRWNIFVGKFLRDFTDGNIPSVYTDGITVGKKFKTK